VPQFIRSDFDILAADYLQICLRRIEALRAQSLVIRPRGGGGDRQKYGSQSVIGLLLF